MNMRKFAATEFIRLDDLQDGPREETIAGIVEGKFDKPDVIFESGAKMGLNKTSTLTLCKAYGDEEEAWIGKVVELFAGTIRYQGSDKGLSWCGRSRRRSKRPLPKKPSRRPSMMRFRFSRAS